MNSFYCIRLHCTILFDNFIKERNYNTYIVDKTEGFQSPFFSFVPGQSFEFYNWMGLDSPETGKALSWMILADITRSKPQPVHLLYSSIWNLNTDYLHFLLVCLFSIVNPPYLWILFIGSTIGAATQANKPGTSPQWPKVPQDQTFSDRPTTPVTVIFSFTCSRP